METGFRGFSTQWKGVSENFPHNGSMFRALFHTMETCFGAGFHGLERAGPEGLEGREGGKGGDKKRRHRGGRRRGGGEVDYFLAFFSFGGSQATMRHMEDSISMPRSGKHPM